MAVMIVRDGSFDDNSWQLWRQFRAVMVIAYGSYGGSLWQLWWQFMTSMLARESIQWQGSGKYSLMF